MARLRLDSVAFGAATLVALSVGFERLEPSLGLTPDLRLTNLRLLQLATLGLWLAACALGRRWPRLPRPIAVPAAVWLGSVGVSAVLAPTHQLFALAFARDLAVGAIWGWAVYDLATTQARQVTLARALAISGMAVAALGLLEAARAGPVVDWLAGFRYQDSFSIGDVPRISSSLAHPNIMAMLLGLSLPLQLAWLLGGARAPWARLLLGLGMAAGLLALVLTLSRAGVVVTGLVLGLMAACASWRTQPRFLRASLAAALGLLATVGVVLVSQPVLRLRLSSESAASWYRADYATPQAVSAQPGQMASVPVRLTNTGARAWSAGGAHPFALSYHLDVSDGSSLNYDGLRTPLPADVPPGGSIELQAQVVAPLSPGTYVLEWDGVQESVTWFTWAGTPPARTMLTVTGPPASSQQVLPATPPPSSASATPPGRLAQWRIALRMARNRPLLGQGPDNFRWVYGDFAGIAVWDTGSHANSVYFEWLADLGLPGLAAFVWLAYRLLRTSLRSLSSVDAGWAWRLGLFGALAAWFLHGLLDYFYEPLPTNVAFWLVAALACASASM